jgi:hypothetical protein
MNRPGELRRFAERSQHRVADLRRSLAIRQTHPDNGNSSFGPLRCRSLGNKAREVMARSAPAPARCPTRGLPNRCAAAVSIATNRS